MTELNELLLFLSRLRELRQRLEISRSGGEVLTLADFAWGTRTRKALLNGGIRTVGQLLERSSGELLALKNFGPRCLDEVRSHLAEHGLALRGEHPQPPLVSA
jgi:DNA-directed RNA polymerase alpha subunit